MQRLKTCDKSFLFVCGDIELNPGPSNMSVLTQRLARIGRQPVSIVGDGNCFFRSVSHQLYGTEDCHHQIRALAIQQLINFPEYFVEYITEQSWLSYLQNMSRLGTWADHIVIQAVANTNNLRINVTETALNFSESTVVSPISTRTENQEQGSNARDIFIGHLDELHYVSTSPITPCIMQSVNSQITNETTYDKSTADSQHSQSNKTFSKLKKTGPTKISEKRKLYMKEYMKNIRKENAFKKREIDRKKSYNKNYKNSNPEKTKESWSKASTTYRKLNPDKVKESSNTSTTTYRKLNAKKIKEIFKKATAKYMHDKPEKVKESKKRATASYKKSNPEKFKESSIKSTKSYRHTNPVKVQDTQKKKYMKRKQVYIENEHTVGQNMFKSTSHGQSTNFFKNFEESSNDTRLPACFSVTVPKAIQQFHKNIAVGPEYICTSCDQLWYKSSVTECNTSLYKSCSKEILDLCLTGLKSIDNLEWICGTCHSNLKLGKFPMCAKANKMTFPEKPNVLKNLTQLEERLVSPRIPFMQVRELPSGGQLSIHGNVVNVPADVNTTVSILPRPINESQTIPIKLKRRLEYKHHYQFQNVRPAKVL